VENVVPLCAAAGELGIQYLTLYAFSSENWNRPQEEIDALMSLLERFLDSQEKEMHKQGLRLRTIGRVRTAASVAQRLREVCESTAGRRAAP
jgi:undecaprenyl diphosphate synthase